MEQKKPRPIKGAAAFFAESILVPGFVNPGCPARLLPGPQAGMA